MLRMWSHAQKNPWLEIHTWKLSACRWRLAHRGGKDYLGKQVEKEARDSAQAGVLESAVSVQSAGPSMTGSVQGLEERRRQPL